MNLKFLNAAECMDLSSLNEYKELQWNWTVQSVDIFLFLTVFKEIKVYSIKVVYRWGIVKIYFIDHIEHVMQSRF